MIDPVLSLGALSLSLATAPAPASSDPGPSPECPPDMRLVVGQHRDMMAHLCVDPRPGRKDTHCYRYAEGLSAMEGAVTDVRVCMDQYEAPNRRGARPLVMHSFRSAKRFCQRRGKRLCTEQEWEVACEGPWHQPWVYGWALDVRLCNSNRQWKAVDFEAFGGDPEVARRESDRLWQGTPSGRYRTCVSPFGIFDMMGNVEEWVSSREGRRWPGALMGGFWAKPWTGCRGTNDAHQPGFAFYETGFRCCQTPTEQTDEP
jgi:hypothetical protein